jgi:hypothetical protein
MQPPLMLARFLRRVDLRAQVVGAQKVIRDPKLADRVAF